MLTMDEARTRVARGAAHLDQVRPGWEQRIDVGTLTLHDPCGCIVGQLCGNFNDHRQSLIDDSDGEEYGLNLIDETGPSEVWSLLQDAWIEAIADRRLKANAKPIDALMPVPVRA